MKLSISQLKSYAQQAGFSGSAIDTIVAIAMAESGGETGATNTEGNSAGIDRGVLQINSFFHSEVSDSCAFDALCSFKEAFRISNNGASFTPWASFTNGSYKQFLGTAESIAPGISTLNNSVGSGNPLQAWIQTIQPLVTWLSNPLRIVKLLTGSVLVFIGLAVLAFPEQAKGLIHV